MLTGQVAPPAERYNLREDLRAWVAAVRGLRENPLVTHLRLAEQRRLKRIPRWRRNLPLTITALGLVLAFILLLRTWLAASGVPLYMLATYQVIIAVVILTAVWFMQGIYNCVVGALGVLGRYHKRPNHLCIDDFACLSSLTDHEMVVGAVFVLLPQVIWRVVLIGMEICTLPAWVWWYRNLTAQDLHMQFSARYYSSFDNPLPGLPDGFWISLLTYTAILALQLILTGVLGGAGLTLMFISLGRSLKIESFGALSAVVYAIAQVIYPIVLVFSIISADQGVYWGDRSSTTTFLLSMAIMLLWFPALMALAMGLARRNAFIRLSLAIASPLLLLAIIWPSTFLFYSVFEAVCSEAALGDLMSASAHAFALSFASVSVLAPILTVDPTNLTDMHNSPWFNGDWGGGRDWITDVLQVMSARLLFVLLLQAIMLFILSRFAREAVRARRSRGD
jgi:hypothetical protein